MTEKKVVIAGAGIIGLATAYQLQKKHPNIRIHLIEKEQQVARHQTGNNSGVIHSGIYYSPGSLKAETCRRGYNYLLEFCRQENVPFDICGKVIAATCESEWQTLKTLQERAVANGLSGVRRISSTEAREIEPHLRCQMALHVPEAGIVDYKLVCEKLLTRILGRGGEAHFNCKVIRVSDNGLIQTTGGDIEFDVFVNCGGLYSDRIAESEELRIVPFRGEYYTLKKHREYLVNHLIYPVPNPNLPFLGVHFTRMIAGGVEAGPNAVLALKREGYSWGDISVRDIADTLTWPGFYSVAGSYWKTGLGEVWRSLNKLAFTKALQKLVPDVTAEDLVSGGAGVRAQACDVNGGLVDDFWITEKNNQVHVLNAPSPAATASLAIGEKVAEKVISQL